MLAAVVKVSEPRGYHMGEWDGKQGGVVILEVIGQPGFWVGSLAVQRPGEAKPRPVAFFGRMDEYSPRNAMLLCMGAMSAHKCDRGEARENGKFAARCGAPA